MCVCVLSGAVAMYANVKHLLQSAERSNRVRLASLALRPLHFRPVVRALQFQTSLKELELPGKRLSCLSVYLNNVAVCSVSVFLYSFSVRPVISESSRPIFTGFSGLVELWQYSLELVFRSLKGRCNGYKILLILVDGCRWTQAASGTAGQANVGLSRASVIETKVPAFLSIL